MNFWSALIGWAFMQDEEDKRKEEMHQELMDRLDPRNSLDYEEDEWDGISDPW